jgi:L-aspartate oxidase
VSCTGVHGANRLASNSLLEGLVFAHRIADDITERLAAGDLQPVPPGQAGRPPGPAALLDEADRVGVQSAMTQGAGAVRTAESLASTRDALAVLATASLEEGSAEPGPQAWETTNLLHVGQLLTHLAARREETRGGHVRDDFPEADDRWRGNQRARRGPDGRLTTSFHPVPEQDLP